MALIRRLAMFGGAAAAAAFFLKKRQEAGSDAPGFAHDVGDAAAAGTGASETMQESGGPEEPTVGEPAAVGDDAGAQATQVSTAVADASSDPLVREQENAAAAEAGAIGGEPDTPPSQEDVGIAEDPAMKPVQEASGEEPEALEDADRDRGLNRERQG